MFRNKVITNSYIEAIENIIMETEIEKEETNNRLVREMSIYETDPDTDTVEQGEESNNNEKINFTYSASDKKVCIFFD